MMRQRNGSIRTHRVISDYGVEDYYKDYKRKHKESDLTPKQYADILDDVLIGIRDRMSTTMYDYKLPSALGKIVIRKYRPKIKLDDNGDPIVRLAPDWKATKQMWKDYPETKEKKQLVYHTNEHSSGYLFVIDYKKDNCKFLNRIFYAAQINRQFKRNVSKSITDGTFDSLKPDKSAYYV